MANDDDDEDQIVDQLEKALLDNPEPVEVHENENPNSNENENDNEIKLDKEE